jgi:phosphonatase-like hydrolase
MAIELIVFDLVGTTVKDNKDIHRILRHTLLQYDVEITLEDANAVMGIPKPIAITKLLERFYKGTRPVTEAWVSEIHHVFVKQMIDFYSTDPSVGESDGVTETFQKLKDSKLKIAVDTGFDRQIANPLLERLGWQRSNLIQASVTSDEVKRGRPYPDLLYKAMELVSVTDVKKVAKVGDTVSDLQEGTSAGCAFVIGITSGAFSREELQKEKHTHLITQVREVLDILEVNN